MLRKISLRASLLVVILLVVALGFAGCLGAKKPHSNSTTQTQNETAKIDLAMATLSEDQAAEIEALKKLVLLPHNPPFKNERELSQIYSEWFCRGYAYVIVTGLEHLPDQVARSIGTERAKAMGWFAGNSAGGLARRSREIESRIKLFTTNQSTGTNGLLQGK